MVRVPRYGKAKCGPGRASNLNAARGGLAPKGPGSRCSWAASVHGLEADVFLRKHRIHRTVRRPPPGTWGTPAPWLHAMYLDVRDLYVLRTSGCLRGGGQTAWSSV